MNLRPLILAACGLLLLQAPEACAGMPVPLPTDFKPSDLTYEVGRMMRLEPDALLRLRTISFFLFGFLAAVWGFQRLWNYLQRDFTKLPRLSYGKALGLVFLWGLLFVIVLTMISGARELMTPGAWKKQGYTYKLAAPKEAAANSEAARRQGLEKLRTALWHFAATHQGKFPSKQELSAIATELWEVPATAGTRYLYVDGMSAGHAPAPLVCEPDLDPEQRFVLRADGEIVIMRSDEIEKLLTRGGS
jgi:hypothetical protein